MGSLEALPVGRSRLWTLLVVVCICLMIVACSFVCFGHAFAGAGETNYVLLVFSMLTREGRRTSAASIGTGAEHGVFLCDAFFTSFGLEVVPGAGPLLQDALVGNSTRGLGVSIVSSSAILCTRCIGIDASRS